jgi:hypothetical protein
MFYIGIDLSMWKTTETNIERTSSSILGYGHLNAEIQFVLAMLLRIRSSNTSKHKKVSHAQSLQVQVIPFKGSTTLAGTNPGDVPPLV